ncbi:DUF4440 domain-containing protein [Rhizobium sp. P38BS-XIX]|uniref:YybH family protein n=1 Tax=Rhizobium sp. P38BS-XIX TaxID=2726740 RepID=UPI0014577AEF|nr:DUF4440 domain-containing protein [Rhizobium sp. P38BS-XIX]NLS00081.1 DUF4440 domain-containing protein [Rhizobium sp. P38BS-XIX]
MLPDDHMRLYQEKINRREFDDIAPLIAMDAIFWVTNDTFCGIKAIRKAFETTWQKFNSTNYWFEDLIWIAENESIASCVYRFRWKASMAGAVFEGQGRGSSVLRKEGPRWQIVHEHLGRLPS